ncbi:hypothetical protein LJ737_23725 [Hymenobacter sp. 15J16-1T3B]|uniref:hypothetical protein n=1 Tax=Hymenobacter sp. 15J16-1T3B TaxID=2886941 RepID=UPI001D0FD819|nr:hypothetical protein [Hymenobacter sp. 15J16-1T3B]MCC3160267.1 hypothetical protein [Hymenobacter sp. 15J16-1T3B]
MPAEQHLLLVVASTLRLPGLGTLVGAGRYEAALHRFPLHSSLEVELRLPGGPLVVPATVEELQRPADAPDADATTDYVLLLDSDRVGELPAGTEVWLPAVWAEIYGL